MTLNSAAVMIGLFLSATIVPQSASAQAIGNGRDLKERCATFQLANPSAGLGCRGYIGAVADILAAGNTIESYRACPPSDAKREDLVRSVKAWLDRQPGLLQLEAFRLVAQALSEHHPCPE